MGRSLAVLPEQYAALAEFRYQIRRFLAFSERAARDGGIEPQQHQLLLAIRAHSGPEPPTIGELAERLQVRHHSAVELIDRTEQRGLVHRAGGQIDKRTVAVELSRAGERLLEKLSEGHLAEISETGPALVRALEQLIPDMERAR